MDGTTRVNVANIALDPLLYNIHIYTIQILYYGLESFNRSGNEIGVWKLTGTN